MPELIPKHNNGRLIPLNNKAMRDYQNQEISLSRQRLLDKAIIKE